MRQKIVLILRIYYVMIAKQFIQIVKSAILIMETLNVPNVIVQVAILTFKPIKLPVITLAI